MPLSLQALLAPYRSVSFVGLCKNAGKTTALCAALRGLPEGEVAGVTSIGRDGEAVDVVTGTEKPAVWVREGTLCATASGLLRLGDATRELLETTGVRTPLGEVVIFRAASDGTVQLAGPSMRDQLAAVAARLFALGATRTYLDGAAGRVSLCAPSVGEACVLCAGASCHPDMARVAALTADLCARLTLPAPPDESPREGRRCVEGAVTDAVADALVGAREIVCEDASRLLLSPARFDRLRARGVRFYVRRPARLAAVCCNPRAATGPDFDPAAFLRALRAVCPVPVLDVKEPPA